jgi:hypothetical protein
MTGADAREAIRGSGAHLLRYPHVYRHAMKLAPQ